MEILQSQSDIIHRIESLDRYYVENALARYLVARKGMSPESFKIYLDRAKQIDQSVYNVMCEIENVMTYEELRTVFQELTGISIADQVRGKVINIKEGRLIVSLLDGPHENETHVYAWHPMALKEFSKDKPGNTRFLLLKKDDFQNTEIKNGHISQAESMTAVVSDSQVSRGYIYPFIRDALLHGSTDIHIFPQDNQDIYKIRFRLLGDLVDVYTLKTEKGRSLVNVLINWAKEMTPSLKTDEKRRPLDGKIICKKEDIGWHTDVDLRMSLIWKPDAANSDVVLRILAKTDIRNEKLYDLGYLDYHINVFETAVSRNRGIILVTGPTGSGKSRTVNTLLAGLPSTKCILCVEDPIEYQIPGGRQFQTFEYVEDAGSDKAGKGNINVVGFSEFARAFKRHDPDVIFIGELRDKETVNTAVHLSKTGHLVLGTLHVSRATQIPQMLVEDYGVSIDAVADNLIMGVNQVLVKKLCNGCKQEMTGALSAPEWTKKLRYPERDLFLTNIRDGRFYIPNLSDGCEACRKVIGEHGTSRRILSTGYSGRTVLGEAIEFRASHFSDGRISGFAMEQKIETADMSHSILMDAYNKLVSGTIDMDAVMRLL
ncbi:MAG: GspE/PulE family protein [Syntrophorhabdaceae bacterium]